MLRDKHKEGDARGTCKVRHGTSSIHFRRTMDDPVYKHIGPRAMLWQELDGPGGVSHNLVFWMCSTIFQRFSGLSNRKNPWSFGWLSLPQRTPPNHCGDSKSLRYNGKGSADTVFLGEDGSKPVRILKHCDNSKTLDNMKHHQGKEIRIPVPGPSNNVYGEKSPEWFCLFFQEIIWTRGGPQKNEQKSSSRCRYEDWISQTIVFLVWRGPLGSSSLRTKRKKMRIALRLLQTSLALRQVLASLWDPSGMLGSRVRSWGFSNSKPNMTGRRFQHTMDMMPL